MTNIDVQAWINFATPIAVIVAAVLQRLATNKIDAKADTIVSKTDTNNIKTDVLNGKVDQVHTLTNDQMSKMVAKVAELQGIINNNTATHLDAKLADIKQTILDNTKKVP